MTEWKHGDLKVRVEDWSKMAHFDRGKGVPLAPSRMPEPPDLWELNRAPGSKARLDECRANALAAMRRVASYQESIRRMTPSEYTRAPAHVIRHHPKSAESWMNEKLDELRAEERRQGVPEEDRFDADSEFKRILNDEILRNLTELADRVTEAASGKGKEEDMKDSDEARDMAEEMCDGKVSPAEAIADAVAPAGTEAFGKAHQVLSDYQDPVQPGRRRVRVEHWEDAACFGHYESKLPLLHGPAGAHVARMVQQCLDIGLASKNFHARVGVSNEPPFGATQPAADGRNQAAVVTFQCHGDPRRTVRVSIRLDLDRGPMDGPTPKLMECGTVDAEEGVYRDRVGMGEWALVPALDWLARAGDRDGDFRYRDHGGFRRPDTEEQSNVSCSLGFRDWPESTRVRLAGRSAKILHAFVNQIELAARKKAGPAADGGRLRRACVAALAMASPPVVGQVLLQAHAVDAIADRALEIMDEAKGEKE